MRPARPEFFQRAKKPRGVQRTVVIEEIDIARHARIAVKDNGFPADDQIANAMGREKL